MMMTSVNPQLTYSVDFLSAPMQGIEEADLLKRLQVAIEAGNLASKLIQEAFKKQRVGGQPESTAKESDDRDLLTQLDVACDDAIRCFLRQNFPEDFQLTEESYQEGWPFTLESTWVVDPLDGTRNFVHGFPCCAVSIAYLVHGKPKLAVVIDPLHDEVFYALKNHGAFLNGQPITTSPTPQLADALVSVGFPNAAGGMFREESDLFLFAVQRANGVRRLGVAALEMAYVAAGRLDSFCQLGLSPWDVAAGYLLVQEAGGLATQWHGEAVSFADRRFSVLASNGLPSIHWAMQEACQLTGVPQRTRRAYSRLVF